MSTPIEQIATLTVGTVESVSPSEIRVLLEPNAPQATALNTGVPVGFPRINGYLLIPNETGALVGLIVWLGVERSQFPKRTGLKDFGLVDLPFPLRKISLTPLGTLVACKDEENIDSAFNLERGVLSYPSVGDTAQLPTGEQLKSIIEPSKKEDKRVQIGISPLAMNATISVDPDKVFGRHIAVLGNTGSGKSCSVAGLIRWSLEAARNKRTEEKKANARFIILDTNGEYSKAFQDYDSVRRFQVNPKNQKDIEPLLLPAWMWNSQEWSAFAHAAPGIQRPILLQGLREMRAGESLNDPIEVQVNRLFSGYKRKLEERIAQGPEGYTGTKEASNTGRLISNISEDSKTRSTEIDDNHDLKEKLISLSDESGRVADSRHWDNDRSKRNRGFNDFSETDIKSVISKIVQVLDLINIRKTISVINEDAPMKFDVKDFPNHLEQIASDSPVGQAVQFISTLSMRIRMMLADRRLGPVVDPQEREITFQEWLESYIGKNQSENGELAIVDLSLIPSDVLHMIIAVVARIVFEAIQRYRKIKDLELPTVLVLEEAHTFVKRGSDDESSSPSASQMCRHTFERIAREGRKFGLGLVLSSQRPSELSPTVLAQCNTFLLHRIVNDRDQDLVSKLVPDNLGGLLKELPSLPTRQAILLGWASTVPTLVEIYELTDAQRPRSADPKFWDVWTWSEDRTIDWKEIVRDWTGIQTENTNAEDHKKEGKNENNDTEDEFPF